MSVQEQSVFRRHGCPEPLRSLRDAVLLVSLLVVFNPEVAEACTFPDNTYVLDAAEQLMDKQPPSTPMVGPVTIHRGRGAQTSGCGSSYASSCDDLGAVSFSVAATDDRTSAELMGYRLSVTRGQAPNWFSSGSDVQNFGGIVYMTWLDGATDDQEDLDFDMTVHAIDRAGNVSTEGVAITVRDGQGGCRVAAGRRLGGGSLVLGSIGAVIVAGLAIARKRRGEALAARPSLTSPFATRR